MAAMRSSRRWSERAIRPSGPTGWTGLPTKSWRTPVSDKCGSGVVLALVDDLALGDLVVGSVQLGRRRWRRARLVVLVVLVVVTQTLGLGLEDPQRLARAPRELGQLRGTEDQDHDREDHEPLSALRRPDHRKHVKPTLVVPVAAGCCRVQ